MMELLQFVLVWKRWKGRGGGSGGGAVWAIWLFVYLSCSLRLLLVVVFPLCKYCPPGGGFLQLALITRV